MISMFHMTVEEALEFFERVQKLLVDNEEERTKLLIQMANEGKKIAISKTERTKEQVIKDYSKHGKVLYIKGEEHGL